MKTKILLSATAVLVALVIGLTQLKVAHQNWKPDSRKSVIYPAKPQNSLSILGKATGQGRDAIGCIYMDPDSKLVIPLDPITMKPEVPDDVPALLARLTAMSESPAKEAMLRETLAEWALRDGRAAATWAMNQREHRRFLPDMLRVWASSGTESAVAAWAFAKGGFAADGDEATWRAEGFVTAAFREMAAIAGEGVWSELAALSGPASTAAMIGMADFASNRQVNTDFASEMEERVLASESAALAAAFYAGGGHIAAAKQELASVTDPGQWHTVVREVARHQAVFEPAKALLWLQGQFQDPAGAIPDAVASIGMMHALNAGDVLQWLDSLPESDARTAGMDRIRAAFPELGATGSDQVISFD